MGSDEFNNPPLSSTFSHLLNDKHLFLIETGNEGERERGCNMQRRSPTEIKPRGHLAYAPQPRGDTMPANLLQKPILNQI